MKLVPLGDRVVLKQVVVEETTVAGIVIPGAKEKPQEAEVIAIGKDVKIPVKVGNTVLFSKFAGVEYKMNGEEYLILESKDVVAIIEG